MKTLFRALALLPLPVLHAFGAALGWVSFLASATYRQRFVANARQAGYGLAQVRAAVAEAGKLVAEAPRLWFGRSPAIEWEGAQLIDAGLALGKGIVFLTPHLGCFEATAQGYAARYGRITVLYRPARKAWLRDLVDTSRARANLATAPTTLAGVKQMLKALKAGEAVGLLPDQVPPQNLGVWAPFFDRPAYTMTLSARLAQQTGATVLLAWGQRLAWGRGFRIHLRAWPGELPGTPADAAAQVNAQMERLVRECPQQYLWGYARYKEPAPGRAA
ncbi:lysophospholipid acyltransferase family protein [Ramlibacter sp. WS9]|uniref:lysophospholipid acyltransferase family protein n=1 Tax=Ramlibacter sp. WS9 TaxID=1882741 RepID=UPI0011420B55|nr:lysophospholipid acyltransferase family protein [Ramlibacter sp. WS9]ROZ77561.1 lysophospholipid acyltransferase family protein [Ramlibacter sp. WS9]